MNPYCLAANTFEDDEIKAAKAALDSGRLTFGERIVAFEAAFAAWTGARHAVMVNSGSSANLLAVDVMLRRSRGEAPWAPGDEVLVPALSWPTTVWPIVQLGLVPVFVDVDPDTLAISLESAASALSPRTKGMFLIHVLGRVPNMDAYMAFCARHGITLLEDTCESLGGHHAGVHAGNFGLLGTFSFYFSHHVSTIEGGMIVTGDDAVRDDLRSLRSHGWIRDRSDRATWTSEHPEVDERFMFVMPGYNVRATEIQGAIGQIQLQRLDGMLERREALARKVRDWLAKSAPWLRLVGADQLPGENQPVARRARTHSWMTLPLMLDAGAPLGAPGLRAFFAERDVESRPIIAGNLARHPASRRIKSRSAASLARCDEVFTRGLMLGCHPVPTPGSIETLENAIAALARL